jgi:hypothetical protein
MSTNPPPVLGSRGKRLDLWIQQGATWGPHRMTIRNPDGTPMDLTGASMRAHLRRKALDPVALLAFTFTALDAVNGVMQWDQVAAAVTAGLTAGEDPMQIASRAVWDGELVDASGRVLRPMWGQVTIDREVTRT